MLYFGQVERQLSRFMARTECGCSRLLALKFHRGGRRRVRFRSVRTELMGEQARALGLELGQYQTRGN